MNKIKINILIIFIFVLNNILISQNNFDENWQITENTKNFLPFPMAEGQIILKLKDNRPITDVEILKLENLLNIPLKLLDN